MIIICPECSTKYNISPGMLTPNGRKVKCTKCKLAWFQEYSNTWRDEKSAPPAHKSISISKSFWLRVCSILSVMLTVAVFLLVFEDFMREKVPYADSFYNKLGIHSTKNIILSDIIVYEKKGGVIDINGILVNQGAVKRKAPKILVSFIDQKQNLTNKLIQPPLPYLEPGEKCPFYKAIHDLPHGAQIISIELANKLYLLGAN